MSILGISVRAKSAVQRGYEALVRRQEGASAVEYALLVALIAVVIIIAVRALGQNVADNLNDVATAMPSD